MNRHFNTAIVRQPCPEMVNGITSANLGKPDFGKFNCIEVPVQEAYAANSLWINGTVLVPKGFPVTLAKIEKAGYPIIEIDVSEFQKLDGGLSCLSLRF